jgi:autotransporter-associated beta strand protein
VLSVGSDNNLGDSSKSVAINGATLAINNAFSSSRSIVIGSNGATINASGLGDNGVQTFSGLISGNGGLTIAANGSVNSDGDNSMILSGSNTYTGTTTITAGVVRASSDAAFGNAANTLVLNGGGLYVSNDSSTTINRAIQLGSGGGTFRTAEYYQTFQTNYPFGDIFHWFPDVSVANTYQSGVLTLNGSISGSGNLKIVEGGVVNLNASNSFSGETGFNNTGLGNGSTLNLNNVNALLNSTLNINSEDNATVNFAVAGTNTYNIGGLKGSGNVGFGSNIFAVGGNDQSTTYSGSLSGAGGLIKTGEGTLTLSGNNSYSGGTTISGGALIIGNGASSGSIAGNVVDNGTLIFNRTGSIAFAGVISGSGDLLQTGTGTTTLSSSNNFSGATRVIAGKINLGNANALSQSTLVLDPSDSGSIGFTGGSALTYNLGGLGGSRNLSLGSNSLAVGSNGQNTLYSGSLSGSGSLTKTGSGELNLTGSNNYTGGTAVNSGTLRVNGSVTGNVSVASGAVLGGSGVIAGNTEISGTHSPGNSPGIQTFGGNLTYQPGATMLWQLADNTTINSPLAFDQVIVGGNLNFNGGTSLVLSFNDVGSLVNWTDSLWSSNQSWTIYQVSGSTTGLTNLSLADYYALLDASGNSFGSTLTGASFSIKQSGQDVVLEYNAASVPEPSTYVLFGLGALALVIAYQRKRA